MQVAYTGSTGEKTGRIGDRAVRFDGDAERLELVDGVGQHGIVENVRDRCDGRIGGTDLTAGSGTVVGGAERTRCPSDRLVDVGAKSGSPSAAIDPGRVGLDAKSGVMRPRRSR